MSVSEIGKWIKGKFSWVLNNWVTILVVFIALLILVWFITKLLRDTMKGE
jgi:ABC-type enterochelin transport system permease subunit